MSGPLHGIRIVELAGLGPGPFAALVLSDMGAEVIRIDRPARPEDARTRPYERDVLVRGRRSIAVDLKNPDGVEAVLVLLEQADALIEPFRPGVMERLGLGPQVCLERNERLIYGRMTGWGQEGPYAHVAGHDINYIALNGVLGSIGRFGEPPTPPLNLVGDFGGGGMFMALGIVAGILEARTSGRGQVLDVAMVDGSAVMMAMFQRELAVGEHRLVRGTNMLDSGAPYYDAYECADGEYVTIGAIEPQFYAELRRRCGIDRDETFDQQNDRAAWPEMKARLTELFRTRTRAQWCELLEGTDACFAPVLNMREALDHPQMQARGTFVEAYGVTQAAPAPRFSRTPGSIQRRPPRPGEHTDEVLAMLGFDPARIAELRASGAVS
jgi:alpha-methylacyl-CoA racemase